MRVDIYNSYVPRPRALVRDEAIAQTERGPERIGDDCGCVAHDAIDIEELVGKIRDMLGHSILRGHDA